MKKLFLFLLVTALMWRVCIADLTDTVWTRSFEPEDVIDAKFSPDDSLIHVSTLGGVYSV